jgi:hypothetical protein
VSEASTDTPSMVERVLWAVLTVATLAACTLLVRLLARS